jgi:multiple sugar transport system ATP-binding protein
MVADAASIEFRDVTKVFPDGTMAVDHLNLSISPGEFMVLVGPSGCGKTTALRMLAGLEDVSSGTISIDGKVVNDLDPRQRDVAMVFQNYALYPNMTVRDNIGFGLKMRGTPKEQLRARVESIAQTLALGELLDRKPAALSGGQRQRVAMGRAIVREPQVFLMDEPLSNLDAKLRVQVRSEISQIQRVVGATTVYVTHDQVEAMTMGDRVAVIRKGELQQLATPREVYDQPANLFVASFIGSPPMNLVEARVDSCRADQVKLMVGDRQLVIPLDSRRSLALAPYAGRAVALGIRPEDIEAAQGSDVAQIYGRVLAVEELGAEVLLHVEIAGKPVTADAVLEIAADVDAAAADRIAAERERTIATMIARMNRNTQAVVGQQFAFRLASERIHFFDLESGSALAG